MIAGGIRDGYLSIAAIGKYLLRRMVLVLIGSSCCVLRWVHPSANEKRDHPPGKGPNLAPMLARKLNQLFDIFIRHFKVLRHSSMGDQAISDIQTHL